MEAGAALSAEGMRAYRTRAVFALGKLDPQAGDHCALAPYPLVMRRGVVGEVGALAERLDAEMLACERAVVADDGLLAAVRLPRRVAQAVRSQRGGAGFCWPRFSRYDFHWTTEGWRISEVNSDVPGGFVESAALASCFALGAGVRAGVAPCPAGALVAAWARRLPAGGVVALVHATAFVDDRQVMMFLKSRLEGAGIRGVLCGPDQCRPGEMRVGAPGFSGGVDGVVRFFPGEWLAQLDGGWGSYFAGHLAQSNPGTALVSQSKRAPIVWRMGGLATPVWDALLPRTCAVGDAGPGWVLKPALGRVGEDVAIEGVSDAKVRRRARVWSRLHPGAWVAQERFTSVPVATPEGDRHVCLGVFVVDGAFAGLYARVAAVPLIDARAQDVPVWVVEDASVEKRLGVAAGAVA